MCKGKEFGTGVFLMQHVFAAQLPGMHWSPEAGLSFDGVLWVEAEHSCERSHFLLFFSCQVLKGAPASGISMTARTTNVRMEGFVWTESILTTAAVPLSGQVGAGVNPQGRAWVLHACHYSCLATPTARPLGVALTSHSLPTLECAFSGSTGQQLWAGTGAVPDPRAELSIG